MSRLFGFYRSWVSPWLHSISGVSGACRFQPTCSEYTMTAVASHGLLYGAALGVWRVLRCNPLSRGGFDPVPGTYPVTTAPPATHPNSKAVGEPATPQMTPAIYH